MLDRLPDLKLPQCYLTAGCLFQTVWNQRSGNAPDWGIKDYDIFYYDPSDLSWEAEDRIIKRVAETFADIDVSIEIRNQARVHLWYEKRFGHPIAPLTSSQAGIDSFLVLCTCVGIDVATGSLYAPNGLEHLYAGRLQMNPTNPAPALFAAKVAGYRDRWDWLQVE